LDEHLASTPLRLIDDKHLDHLRKCNRLISELWRAAPELAPVLDALSDRLRSLEHAAAPGRVEANAADRTEDAGHSGRLREPGRTPTFGFLRNQNGDDCYVSRASVGEATWSALCDGRRASYEIVIGSVGKPQAVNVTVEP
jgi:cold shock CspA family protein